MITSYLDRSWLISIILNSLLLGFAMIIPKKLLTFSGYLHAWLLGVLIWWLLGWQGYILIMSYFIIGSAITYVGISKEEKAGIAEKRSGTRGPENVWGSAAVYGKNTFLITTLKPASPGTEGAISLEGTLAGFIASVLIALVGFFINFINLNEVSYCVISAFFATNVESVIGATLQNRVSWMNNDVVNIINTLIGALIAFFLYFLETNLF